MALVSHHARTDAAFVPLLTLCGTILALYGFALAGALAVAVPLWGALGCLAFGFFIRRQRRAFGFMLSPGFVFFVLLTAGIAVYAHGKMPHQYDNYTHWALMMKTLWQTDALPTADSLIVYSDYPPATALFGYLVLKCTRFGEDVMVCAQGMLAAAALATLFAGCRFRRIGRIFVTLLTAALMIEVIPDNLANLYVDALLGYLAVAACALILFHARDDSFRPLPYAAVLSVLALTKASGAFFVVCAAVFAFFLHLCCKKSAYRFVRAPLSLLFTAGIPLLLRKLYDLYDSRVFGAASQSPFDATYAGFVAESGEKSDAFFETFPDLFRTAITDLSSVPVLVGALLLLCALILIPLLAHTPSSAHRCALIAASIVVSAAYTAGLYLMYVGVMPEDESLQLASFARYLGTGTVFWLGLIWAVLWSAPPEKIPPELAGSLYLWLFSICIGLFGAVDARVHTDEWEAEQAVICAEARLELAAVYEEIAPLVPDTDELLYVIDDRVEPGYYYHIMRYTFMRRYVWPLEPWCVEDDLWGAEQPDCLILILHEGQITTDYLEQCFGVSALAPGLYEKHGTQLTAVMLLGD